MLWAIEKNEKAWRLREKRRRREIMKEEEISAAHEKA